MKKYINIMVLVSFIGSLVWSCDNGLEETVYSSVTQQTYNYSEDDFYPAIAAVYANMRNIWSHTNYYMAQETSADEIVMPANASGWDDGGIYRDMHLHSWNSESPQVNNMWNSFYQGVLHANRVIGQVQDGTVPVPSEVGKESALAELKVARAFYYWLILDNFGDARWLLTRKMQICLPKLPEKNYTNLL